MSDSKMSIGEMRARAYECFERGGKPSARATVDYVGADRKTIKRWFDEWAQSPVLQAQTQVAIAVEDFRGAVSGISHTELARLVVETSAMELVAEQWAIQKIQEQMDSGQTPDKQLVKLVEILRVDSRRVVL